MAPQPATLRPAAGFPYCPVEDRVPRDGAPAAADDDATAAVAAIAGPPF